MDFYGRAAATTLRMIKQYGMLVTLRRQSVGLYDTATLGATVESNDTQRYMLKLDQPGSQIAQRFGANFEKETLRERNEKWGIMDANGPAPQLQDRIIMEGIEYVLLDVQVLGPNGTPVFYQLVMRA